MRTVILLFLWLVMLSGCTLRNMLPVDDDAYCWSATVGLVPWHKGEADGELRQKSPNGWANQPYSRDNWDKYWNSVVFDVWKVGRQSCGGTYEGPSGQEMVRAILVYRAELGLPLVNWDESNIVKGL